MNLSKLTTEDYGFLALAYILGWALKGVGIVLFLVIMLAFYLRKKNENKASA